MTPTEKSADAGPRQRTDPQNVRIRHYVVVLLAVNSGAIDAIGLLSLGGAFSSVMTGNMVLLGISAAHTDGAQARTVGVALVCFILGCALGARIAGEPEAGDGIWPPAVRRALACELVILAAVLLGGFVSGPHRSPGTTLVLLGGNAVALGLQSSAMRRFGIAGLSTTYLTGTLTTVVARLALREQVRNVGHSVAILAGLIAGAVLGGLLVTYARDWSLLLPAVLVGASVVAPMLTWRRSA